MAMAASPGQDRFKFGENWRDFSRGLGDEQLAGARAGVERLLRTADLTDHKFLDVGCGSGLMSLAAYHMGAQVTAFDADAESVATTMAVRDAAVGAEAYAVLQGSALDVAFLRSLGQFDVVYAWGVLHHTGDLWGACEAIADTVVSGGLLAVAIYNDQGVPSQVWKKIKKAYVEGGVLRQRALVATFDIYFRSRLVARALLRGRPVERPRGMDRKHDLVDWVGGYPFEVAKPEEVFEFYRQRGFVLEGLATCAGGLGCNEFVFRRAE